MIYRLLKNDGVMEAARRIQYFEQPSDKRRRLSYEKARRVYKQDMDNKINFVLRKSRIDPFLYDWKFEIEVAKQIKVGSALFDTRGVIVDPLSICIHSVNLLVQNIKGVTDTVPLVLGFLSNKIPRHVSIVKNWCVHYM